jgi:hypothetical protein
MSQKKMTPIIAKALAEKVRAELVARYKGSSETLVTKVETSKLYKEMISTISKIDEFEKKKQTLRTEIEEKFSTNVSDVRLAGYSATPYVHVSYNASFSVDNIKDMILIEDYMSGDAKTPEEFITYIADKLTK